jgi:hypothetical protein
MSDSSNKNQSASSHEPQAPEVHGIGTVKVDGETVYDPATTFTKDASEGAGAFASEASNFADEVVNGVREVAKEVEDTVRSSFEDTSQPKDGDSYKGSGYAYHYPDESTGKPTDAPWAKTNKWAIWFGVVLVTLGTLIFLDMLSGVIPALENIFGGYSIWRFWPVLIIVGGLALAFSPATESPNPRRNGSLSLARFFEGLFTSTVGAVLLACSLGFVSWAMWPAMLSYWPLLLVMAGLAILSRGLKTEWFSVISYVISILILVAVASSMWIGCLPLSEPFASLAEIGSYRGMDLFNIGTRFEYGLHGPR